MAETNEHQIGRIVYIEPNDFEGRINGVPVTPDYTDYCIFFDLIVEVSSRLRTNEEVKDDRNKTYVLSWSSYLKNGEANKETQSVSFLKGEDAKKFTYLSTYYTDIHLNDIVQKNIVEGLGIESATITYESYYTPTIKIRFIDVRGASLFGEESVSHDENEQLRQDTIWGAFFTYPYPKYRLQVKGFYGDVVTYQLTMLNFNAHFNSTTGNFEIDTTFIGYDFGIISDIPIGYLIAAPNCKYEGENYWENQKSSQSWRLSDNKEPVKFTKLMQEIKREIMRLQEENEEEKEKLETEIILRASKRREELDKIKEVFVKLKDELVSDDVKLLTDLFRKDGTSIGYPDVKIYNKLKELQKELKEKFLKFKEEYSDVDDITSKIDTFFLDDNYNPLNFCSLFSQYDVDEEKQNYPFENRETKEKTYVKIVYNESARINFLKIGEIDDDIKIKQYSSPIPQDEYMLTKLGFLPNIGNIFKILYCHLETFIYMLYMCKKTINGQMDDGKRTLKKLGLSSMKEVNISYDDISGVTNEQNNAITPFPEVLTKDKDGNYTLEWVGNLKKAETKWEEERLINSLVSSILYTNSLDADNSETKIRTSSFPVIACDLNRYNRAPILLTGKIDNVAAYLGMRSAMLFGVGNLGSEVAEISGKMDALYFYDLCGNIEVLKENFFNLVGNNNITDELIKILTCKGGDEKHVYSFEKKNNLYSTRETYAQKRHPVLLDNGNSFKYTYFNDKDGTPFVYPNVSTFEEYQVTNTGLEYDDDGNGGVYYIQNDFQNPDILYTRTTNNIITKYNYVDDTKFKNKEMFNIFIGNTYGDGTSFTKSFSDNEFFSNLTSIATVDVNGYTEMINNYLPLYRVYFNLDSVNDIDSYFDNKTLYFVDHLPYRDGNQAVTSFLGATYLSEDDTPEEKAKKNKCFIGPDGKYIGSAEEITNVKRDRHYNEDGDSVTKVSRLKVSSKNLSLNDENVVAIENILRFANIDENGTISNRDSIWYSSVFGSKLYYAQNAAGDTENGRTEDFAYEYEGGVTRFIEAEKAYLFAVSLPMDDVWHKTELFEKENSFVTTLPYGFIIQVGALMWYRRYIKKHGRTPLCTPDKHNGDGDRYVIFPSVDEVPFIGNKTNDVYKQGGIKAYFFYHDDGTTPTATPYLKYSDLIPIDDENVENEFIRVFESFVDNEWVKIKENCELIRKDGNPIKDITYFGKKIYNDEDNFEHYQYFKEGQFGKNYCYCYANDKFELSLKLNEKNEAQEILKKLIKNNITVAYMGKQKNNKSIVLDKSLVRKYINGFVKQLEKINSSDINYGNDETEETDIKSKDIKLEIYTYIRNIWERWLATNDIADYTVEKFMKNSIFIDSMFRNTYELLHINCSTLLKILEGTDGTKMTFQFLADIANKHNCMFFGLPDYMGIGGNNEDIVGPMSRMFKPLPFSKIRNFETQNKFVIMYVHKPSEIAASMNSYKYDSFDIYNTNDNLILDTFKVDALSSSDGVEYNVQNEYERQIKRYGYNIPSFGVPVGRQNNHIFKRIDVGMSNPVQTEQSINALSALAERGRGQAGESTIFYGQDLWNVYSGYSYTCNVEMMGNAQIMPMMYIQLLNIPMFRGAYMIYGVTHTIKPGDMTTSFKAMKMSKKTLPWCTEWYGIAKYNEYGYPISYETYEASENECEDVGNGQFDAYTDVKHTSLNNGKPLPKYKRNFPDTYAESLTCVIIVRVRTTPFINNDNPGKTVWSYLRVNKKLADEIIEIFEDIYNGTVDIKSKKFVFSEITNPVPESKIPNAPCKLSEEESAKIKCKKYGFYCFSNRPANNIESNKLSYHSYGAAIDINPSINPNNRGGKPAEGNFPCDEENGNKGKIRTKDNPIVKTFKRHGWGWGGIGVPGDYMHFSYFDGH